MNRTKIGTPNVNRAFSPLRFVAALLVPLIARCDDKLVSVDTTGGLITVEESGQLKSYRLRPFTEITLDGTSAALGELRPGMSLTVTLSDSETASKIAVHGNLTPGAPAPSPADMSDTQGEPVRHLNIKIRVDGGDQINVGDSHVWIQHLTAKKPIDISINGMKWEPVWTGNTTDLFTGASLARFTSGKVVVQQARGRGATTVIEPPTTNNHETLSFKIKDNAAGADNYEVHVTWDQNDDSQ